MSRKRVVSETNKILLQAICHELYLSQCVRMIAGQRMQPITSSRCRPAWIYLNERGASGKEFGLGPYSFDNRVKFH